MKTKRFDVYDMSSNSEIQVRVGNYLEYIMNPNGTARCPFIRKIVTEGKFYFSESTSVINNATILEALVEELIIKLESIGDPMAICAYVMLHPAMSSPAVAKHLLQLRSHIRVAVISRGYTVAFTHPFNDTGSHSASVHAQKFSSDEPLWLSQIPLLMIRKLHKKDKPFMRTTETQNAFLQVFPDEQFHNIENFLGPDDSLYVYQIEKHFRGEKLHRIVQLNKSMIQVNHEYGFSIFLLDEASVLTWDYTIPFGFFMW